MKRLIALGMMMVLLSTSMVFADDVVFTKQGTKYHKATCSLIKNKSVEKADRAEAVKKGLEPCKKCFKDEISNNTLPEGKKVEKKS